MSEQNSTGNGGGLAALFKVVVSSVAAFFGSGRGAVAASGQSAGAKPASDSVAKPELVIPAAGPSALFPNRPSGDVGGSNQSLGDIAARDLDQPSSAAMMTPYDPVKLKALLTLDERRSARIYQDSMGNWTGGIGRNLSGKGFKDTEIDLMYANDVRDAESDLDANLPWWRALDPVRQIVVVDMAFNMGIGRLLGFVKALHAMSIGDYQTAALEMGASVWANQVGERAERLIDMMKTGQMP